MKKYLLLSICLITISQSVSAGSCTLNFSIADYGTVYDQINYNFIPISSVNPKANGGGQFFVKLNRVWLAANPVPWKQVASVVVSSTDNCDVVYKQGIGNATAEVSYADMTNNRRPSAPPASNAYCLSSTVGAAPGSQTITIPQFGPNNGYWQLCS